ncbi:MAG TPA: glycosyltransferase family 4 protein, partial [Acidimicrobiia bacterium]|nr:glycosyltransferase family 4 protein [Acidimicrobiia bacterium]
MKVLLVTNDYPPKAGGIQQFLAGLVRSLPGDVRVMAPRHGAAVEDGVVRGRARWMLPTRRVRRWIQREIELFSPDILVFGAPTPLAHLGPGLRRRTGVPYAVLCYGAEVALPAAFPIARQLVAWPLRRADAVLALSAYTARRVERLVGKPVPTMGAGVNPRFSPPEERSAEHVVGCVSRFVPRKGQARVLRAVDRLRQEGMDVSVLLVGTGRDEQRLRRLADRLGVPTRFEVGIPYDRLPDMYRQMSVFAMPSRSRWFGLEVEGLGLVYLEASATGVPVVTGDSGGAPETVVPGVTGFVADSDESLIDALRLLISDPGRAR